MGRIGEGFKVIRSRGKKAFIPFFTAFYPSPELFRELLLTADEEGSDFVEIGIPFSDPLADGKMIQHSSHWSLERGFSLPRLLEEVARIKEEVNTSLILMSYLNPIVARGIEKFGRELKEAGVDGVIVPDLPLEESFPLKEVLSANGIDLIYLVAPTTSEERIRRIGDQSSGFIYLVSLTGVTGVRDKLPQDLVCYVERVRKATPKPICVGFGISNAEQAKRVAELADGVIIGSAIVSLIKGREEEKEVLQEIRAFLKSLRRVI